MIAHRIRRILQILILVILAVALFGSLTMYLWNWLMPALFGLRAITFAQALGLVILAKILFGGIHKHGGGHNWRRHMQERWAVMTPEERERFRAGMTRRNWCSPRPATQPNPPQTL